MQVQRSLQQLSLPDFSSTPVCQTSASQSLTVQNIGNQPLDAVSPGLSVGSGFEQVPCSGTLADCTSTFSLSASTSCNLSISFAPTTNGLISGSAVLTDNAQNNTSATQSIMLQGTETAQ